MGKADLAWKKLPTWLLQALGYRTQGANGVQQALELAAGTPFDLLLSDVRLPDGNHHACNSDKRYTKCLTPWI
jgi:CheY-like chemotaxis protein